MRNRFAASFNYSAIPNSSFIFTHLQRAGLTQPLCVNEFTA